MVIAVKGKEVGIGLLWQEELTKYLTDVVRIGPLGDVGSLKVLRQCYEVVVTLRQIKHLVVYQFCVQYSVSYHVTPIPLYDICRTVIQCAVSLQHVFSYVCLTVTFLAVLIKRRIVTGLKRNYSVLVLTRYLE